MKRCPECGLGFPDKDQFCDHDGTLLAEDYPASNPVVSDRTKREVQEIREVDLTDGQSHFRQNWNTLAIVAVGTVAGVAIGLVLFLVYHEITRRPSNQSSSEPSSNVAVTQGQITVPPLRPSPTGSVSPSAEPSPSPSAMLSPVAHPESRRVELSSRPVSTGGGANTGLGTVTIRLTNGTSVEADEVWETGEGIWYRRRGVVNLLERTQVKAIERAIEKASPAPSSSAPIRTSSPIMSP
jgi:hypothetical protein